MVCDSEIRLKIGFGFIYDDFLYVNNSQPHHSVRLIEMLKEEKSYFLQNGNCYVHNLKLDVTLAKWRRRVAEWAFNVRKL